MDSKHFARVCGELSLLNIVCLCYAIGTAMAAGETVAVSVVNGSVADLATYEQGGSLTLLCEVRGLAMSSDFVVSWQHGPDVVSWNGDLREPYASPRFELKVQPLPSRGDTSQGVSHELTISPVMPADAGTYSCIVFSQDPVDPLVATETVNLTVVYFPDERNPDCTPSGPVDVYEGQALLLKCWSDIGHPAVLLTFDSTVSVPGPWSISQNAHSVSQTFLLDGVTPASNGSVYNCKISSHRFPNYTRACTVGPLNVVRRPVVTPGPNSPQPGDPIGPQSSTDPPETPEDPACRRWLIAFLVAAAVATLSIILNVVFLTLRQMRKDRKKEGMENKQQREIMALDELPKSNEKTTTENEAYVNVGVSVD